MEQYIISPESKQLLVDYYRVTGIRVCLFDENGTPIENFPPISMSFSDLHYCEKCKLSSEKFLKECIKSDADAFEIVKMSGKSYINQCPKGFFDAVIPIKCGDNIAFFLMIGQICRSDIAEDAGELLFEKYDCIPTEGFGADEAQKSFETMRRMSFETFKSHVMLLELCAKKIEAEAGLQKSQHSVSVEVVRYINSNLYNEISINDCAEKLNYSVSHLSHVIQKEMGTSFTRYLGSCRIDEAKKLLRMTNMSVEKIATLLHYNSVAYFVKQFKKTAGMTCSEYRELRGSPKKKGKI